MAYTHSKGKGAGKYNGMERASHWKGKRVKAARQIRTNGGSGVAIGTLGTVTSAHRGLDVEFDICVHCGTVTYVRRLAYTDVELAE